MNTGAGFDGLGIRRRPLVLAVLSAAVSVTALGVGGMAYASTVRASGPTAAPPLSGVKMTRVLWHTGEYQMGLTFAFPGTPTYGGWAPNRPYGHEWANRYLTLAVSVVSASVASYRHAVLPAGSAALMSWGNAKAAGEMWVGPNGNLHVTEFVSLGSDWRQTLVPAGIPGDTLLMNWKFAGHSIQGLKAVGLAAGFAEQWSAGPLYGAAPLGEYEPAYSLNPLDNGNQFWWQPLLNLSKIS